MSPRRPSSGTMSNAIRLLLLTVVLAACGFNDPTVPATTLVHVEALGGHCQQGECRSLTAIERDGSVHRFDGDHEVVGQAPHETIAALETALAKTDFMTIRAHPFTGTCPTAFDGQELIYTFWTPDGPERISSCEVEIDPQAPLFVAVEAALVASAL